MRTGRWALLILLSLPIFALLSRRLKEEASTRTVELCVDELEARFLAERAGIPLDQFFSELHTQGVASIGLSEETLEDQWGEAAARVHQLLFSNAHQASRVQRTLRAQGIGDLEIQKTPRGWMLRRKTTFRALLMARVGFDPEKIQRAQQAGLKVVYRIVADPWRADAGMAGGPRPPQELQDGQTRKAILFAADEGGGAATDLSSWRSWLQQNQALVPWFEFQFSPGVSDLAHQMPFLVVRAHTISIAETRSLSPREQTARWLRAVQERSCRFLYIHVPPWVPPASFLNSLHELSHTLQRQGYRLERPVMHTHWAASPVWILRLLVFLAFYTTVVAPLVGLQWAFAQRGAIPRFLAWTSASLLGGLLVAALLSRPEFRLQVETFQGVKVSMFLTVLLSVFLLFSWAELRRWWRGALRRQELIWSLLALLCFTLVWVRMGNTSASFQLPGELGLRGFLEDILRARPRFKEFALGHPFALLGLYLADRKQKVLGDPRYFVVLGMIGQASILNTFCHAHTPLSLSFLRTFHGLWIGLLVGWFLTRLYENCGRWLLRVS